MSFTSKVCLGLACGGSIGIIVYVHYKQWYDKEKLHEGVIKDVERQQRRKIDNLYSLEQQIKLGKILKKQQMEDEAAVFDKLLDDSKK